MTHDPFEFLNHVNDIAAEDARVLHKAAEHYGDSWKKRGGVGAFMMLARKWDRIENKCKQHPGDRSTTDRYDVFQHMERDRRAEGVIDDIRDLRQYLILVEAEARARRYPCAQTKHRDDSPAEPKTADIKQ